MSMALPGESSMVKLPAWDSNITRWQAPRFAHTLTLGRSIRVVVGNI